MEKAIVWSIPFQVVSKPFASLGDMVAYEIEHQVAVLPYSAYIIPGPKVWVDLAVVDNREPIIRRIRKTGQKMNRVDQFRYPPIGHEPKECC